MILNCNEIDQCFALVKSTVEFGLKHERPLVLSQTFFSPTMKQNSNLFVSFIHSGEIIGFYGSPRFNKPIYQNVLSNSFNAGFENNEFPRLNENRLIDLKVELAFIGSITSMSIVFDIDEFCNNLKDNECVLIRYMNCEAMFVSQTQKSFSNKKEFMLALKQKAMIAKDVPWYFINAVKITTLVSYKRKYNEIKSL